MDADRPVIAGTERGRYWRSCSHCQALNDITGPGPHYCGGCLHRADVARADCDCPRCVTDHDRPPGCQRP